MPLILAVEPDRRQAAQLAGVIRHHVGVELILADTTEGALVAIGRRVPDLILVPALLAPQDDAALASALRVIAAATHVRTLTIPVFDNGVRQSPSRKGMLARLGLGRGDDDAPAGCDPTVFAEQVIAYLREVSDERERAESVSRNTMPQPPVAVGEAPPGAEAEPAIEAAPAIEAMPAVEHEPGIDRESRYAAEATVGMDRPAPPGPAPAEHVPAEQPLGEIGAEAEDDQDSIDLSTLLELCIDEERVDATGPADDQPIEVYSLELSPDELMRQMEEAPAFAVTAELEALIDAPALGSSQDAVIDELRAALEEPNAESEWDDTCPLMAGNDAECHGWMPLPIAPGWPALHQRAADAPVAAAVITLSQSVPPPANPVAAATTPVLATPSGPAPAPVASNSGGNGERDAGWIQLVESLRQDIERRKSGPAPVSEDRARVVAAAGKSKRQARHTQPVQDEWGFFDPEQCGFAALLAKLDEITDASASEESGASRAR